MIAKINKKALLCTITAFFWFAQYIYVPFLTPYLTELGIIATIAGVIIGFYGGAQMVMRIPCGILADITGQHKRLISVGCFLAGFSKLGFLMFESPTMFIISNTVAGIASATWISFTVLYASYYKDSENTAAMMMINAFNNIGICVSYILGSIIINFFNIKPLFVLSIISAMIGMFLSFFLPDDIVRREPLKLKELVRVMGDKRLIKYSILAMIFQFVNFASEKSFVPQIAKNLGADGFRLGLSSIIFMLAAITGSFLLSPLLMKKLSKKTLVFLYFGVMSAYCLLMSIVPNLNILFLLQILGGLAATPLFSLLMSFATSHLPPEKRTTGMGFYQSIYGIGMTFGPIMMGIFIDNFDYTVSFIIIGLVALLGIVIMTRREPN